MVNATDSTRLAPSWSSKKKTANTIADTTHCCQRNAGLVPHINQSIQAKTAPKRRKKGSASNVACSTSKLNVRNCPQSVSTGHHIHAGNRRVGIQGDTTSNNHHKTTIPNKHHKPARFLCNVCATRYTREYFILPKNN